jgi:hypothetical protein
MKVLETGCIGEVSSLVFGREDPAGVASHFLAGVSECSFEGNRGDEESVIREGEVGLVSVN